MTIAVTVHSPVLMKQTGPVTIVHVLAFVVWQSSTVMAPDCLLVQKLPTTRPASFQETRSAMEYVIAQKLAKMRQATPDHHWIVTDAHVLLHVVRALKSLGLVFSNKSYPFFLRSTVGMAVWFLVGLASLQVLWMTVFVTVLEIAQMNLTLAGLAKPATAQPLALRQEVTLFAVSRTFNVLTATAKFQ